MQFVDVVGLRIDIMCIILSNTGFWSFSLGPVLGLAPNQSYNTPGQVGTDISLQEWNELYDDISVQFEFNKNTLQYTEISGPDDQISVHYIKISV